MPAISLRELDKHMQADIPFMFPHESYEFDDEVDDWNDYLFEESYEEAHGRHDDYDPFEYDPFFD